MSKPRSGSETGEIHHRMGWSEVREGMARLGKPEMNPDNKLGTPAEVNHSH
jgi:hypothetical protein